MQQTLDVTKPARRTRTRPEVKKPRLWHVVLMDDQDHTYEYVIEMVQDLFAKTLEGAFLVAKKVDLEGRAICMTTHRELAELKVEQIRSFGADWRIASCRGAMSAYIEPADHGDDEEEDTGD